MYILKVLIAEAVISLHEPESIFDYSQIKRLNTTTQSTAPSGKKKRVSECHDVQRGALCSVHSYEKLEIDVYRADMQSVGVGRLTSGGRFRYTVSLFFILYVCRVRRFEYVNRKKIKLFTQ